MCVNYTHEFMARVIIEVNNLQDNGLKGTIVISNAGRDKSNYYIVIEQINENYVLLADGRLKTVKKPKRKKLKHLVITNEVALNLKEALMSNNNELDIMIRKFLKALLKEV
ncbi:hypothetical protein [Clostridium frigidicarnis]|uniref:Ribosomal protein L14E/L6E/L27E n=1 Tax=Clostridium frigidicarnis TaxID=84698 RepID=A0A1I0Z6C0_9CLOT|nr:hypothetical protein [Clostridium frigidicarnis]SFB19978.1 hypothetical protein SAMN04488528_101726 [Clostridium frigidicarnis]